MFLTNAWPNGGTVSVVPIDDQRAIKAWLGNISKIFFITAYPNRLKSNLVRILARFCQNVATMVSMNQYISIMLERCQFKSLWKLMIRVHIRFVNYKQLQYISSSSSKYSASFNLNKVVHFNNVEKMSVQIWLEANLWVYFNICLIMLTALSNLDTSP